MTTAANGTLAVPNYPMAILRGVAALDESDHFRDMPDGFLRVVFRLLKKINLANPLSPITARRETLAREAGRSVETVGRALRWLEDAGLIQREKKAAPGLKGSKSLIHPTQRLIDALGFAWTYPQNGATPPAQIDASVSAPLKHSLTKPSCGDPAKPATQNPGLSQATVRVQGRAIPADLAWMARQGLSVIGILTLMKLASQSGKRLSDVVAVTRGYLDRLRGKALFAYIRKLLQQDKDYAWLARRRQDEAAQGMIEQQAHELVERKAVEWIGRRFHRKDGAVIEIEAGGRFRVTAGREVRVGRIDLALVEAVQDGRLRIC